ncbi:MAG: DUF1615 domain-containing protein [Betaproteobacteria bacterium HGW-Betaproteobacteria-12]|nr:MAG: DUF1615 domain-containing protein [Betaproteobacteria bacterium HGW-Betaproteobacteria-12]
MPEALRRWLPALLLVTVAGCSFLDSEPEGPALPPDMARGANGKTASAWPLSLAKDDAQRRIARLIPSYAKDRAGWAGDLYAAFSALEVPHATQTYCAAIAIIEQEASFQADPAVPGLPRIVRRELEERGERYRIPRLLLDTALEKDSPDGRSYDRRIAALRTEGELNALFEDIIGELPFGRQLFAGYNPVRTGGPMQVSIAFAEQHVQERDYPYPVARKVRDEVFTRRGGVYFGSAILLDYAVPYDQIVYRFADFNAGRYSSRNAAFQAALGRVAGKPLVLDGDLLRYEDGQVSTVASSIEDAALELADQLQMSRPQIRRDLLLEKTAAFGSSPLFQRVFALAEQSAGKPLPRQAMPHIDLKSPKISRKLTTEWFARRVDNRYRGCLKRAG